jgi:hypothetical protein
MTGARGPLPRAPQHRPTWLVLVAALMLMSATRLGLSGLLTLTGNGGGAGGSNALVVSPEEAAAKAVESAMQRVEQSHGRAVKAHACIQVGIALLVLLVVSSVFTLDPRGRSMALVAGWVGVAYHLANAMFGLVILRPEILKMAPAMVAKLSGSIPGANADDAMLSTIKVLSIVMPVMAAGFGIMFCVLILVFFGGRRGRQLYGLEPAPISRGDLA